MSRWKYGRVYSMAAFRDAVEKQSVSPSGFVDAAWKLFLPVEAVTVEDLRDVFGELGLVATIRKRPAYVRGGPLTCWVITYVKHRGLRGSPRVPRGPRFGPAEWLARVELKYPGLLEALRVGGVSQSSLAATYGITDQRVSQIKIQFRNLTESPQLAN
jgi:hypothetical protein